MTDDQDRTEEAPQEGEAKARRVLTDIAPHSWEHPADKAALNALRRIPVFDEVLKKVFGFFGEKPIRLAFQDDAVRVSENQFGDVYTIYKECLRTLDAPEEYPLFMSQTPMVNAGAYGMDKPFIILISGTVRLLEEDELAYVISHEVAHHVQNLLGISQEVRQLGAQNPADRNALSVAQELQADCFAGVWANSVWTDGDVGDPAGIEIDESDIREALNAAAAVGDDKIQLATTGQINQDTWTHGSADQRMEWFTRGFETGDPAECNTFD